MDKLFSGMTVPVSPAHIRLAFRLALVLWITLVGTSLFLNWRQAERSMSEMALIEARSSFNKDLVYRRWTTMHGGVYVPPTEATPPNAYLSGLPDRDLESTTGKKLTLINPAYMTRQVHELGQEQYGTRGHITSLSPIRPQNAADAWEVGALKAFQDGSVEVSSIEIIDGKPFLRFMRRMVTETGCLKCHAVQGYKEGDIRGGISVSVPLAPYLETARHQQAVFAVSHGLVGFLGLLGLWLSGHVLTRSQAALREGHKRLELVLHGANLGSWDLDVATNTFSFNERSAEMFGCMLNKLDPHVSIWEKMIHPEDLSRTREVLNAHLEGRTDFLEIEYRLRHKLGHWVWVQAKGRVIERDAANRPLRACGTFLDITERKQAEEALRKSEEQFRSLFEQAAVGMSILSSSGIWLQVNQRFCEILGYSHTELMALNDRDITHPEHLDHDVERVGQMVAGVRSADSWEKRYIRKDGEVIWVRITASLSRSEDGLPQCFVSVIEDITHRKRAEEALARKVTELNTFLDNIPDMAWIKDAESRFIAVNKAFAEAVGCEKQALINETCAFCFGEEGSRKFQEDDRLVMSSGRQRTFEERIFDSEQRDMWLETIKSPIFDASARVVGTVGVSRDITERKRAEAERDRLQAQLNQAQKMESVGRLAGGVAHDFNNMLGIILGHAELALEEIDSTQQAYADIQEILKATHRSADLVRQLLAFARKQTISPKVLDINETVESMLKMVRRLIGEDIELLWEPGVNLWPVKVDPTQIDQILANLCVNARDAIAGVGKVIIETGNVTLDGTYCREHVGASPGEYVVLAVSDSGCGMDRELLDKLFEPFFTTKEVGKGTGLGLATVYGIVKQNNGFIDVRSETGQGTSFMIYLPRSDISTTEEQSQQQQEINLRGTETVLLVEDETPLLELGRTILERRGYRVLAAPNPAEALALARSYPDSIHLLITDVIMPTMNGKELSEKLSTVKIGFKSIFMSGYTGAIITQRGVIDEGVHFLQKPFSVKSLAEKVREVLDG